MEPIVRDCQPLKASPRIEAGRSTSGDGHVFELVSRPAGVLGADVPSGRYRLVTKRDGSDEIHYRLGHPLAQSLIRWAKERELGPCDVTFDYSAYEGGRISVIEHLCGRTGWLALTLLSVTALDTEEHLLLTGCGDPDEPPEVVVATMASSLERARATVLGEPLLSDDGEGQ
jgi:hypothetical protein